MRCARGKTTLCGARWAPKRVGGPKVDKLGLMFLPTRSQKLTVPRAPTDYSDPACPNLLFVTVRRHSQWPRDDPRGCKSTSVGGTNQVVNCDVSMARVSASGHAVHFELNESLNSHSAGVCPSLLTLPASLSKYLSDTLCLPVCHLAMERNPTPWWAGLVHLQWMQPLALHLFGSLCLRVCHLAMERNPTLWWAAQETRRCWLSRHGGVKKTPRSYYYTAQDELPNPSTS